MRIVLLACVMPWLVATASGQVHERQLFEPASGMLHPEE